MSEDDVIRKEQGSRLAGARADAGYTSARDAALSNRWAESTYRAHENGSRTIDYYDAERYAKRFRSLGARISGRQILYGDDPAPAAGPDVKSVLQVVGKIGAGAEITPDAEQVPPEGLLEIEVPFVVAEGVKAFLVEGASMWPAYANGDVVLCGRQIADAETLIGQEAAVQTAEGRRYLKMVHRASSPGRFDLESHNAPMIRDVRIEWAAEVDLIVKRGKWRQIDRVSQQRIVKSTKTKRISKR